MKKAVKKTTKRRTVETRSRPKASSSREAAIDRWIEQALRRRREATPQQRAKADAEIALVIRSMNEDRVRQGARKISND